MKSILRVRSCFFTQVSCVVGCFLFAATIALAQPAGETLAEEVSAAATVTEDADAVAEEERDLTEELINAVGKSDKDTVKDLLAEGADINAADNRGLTPYKAAQMLGDKKLAKMLEVLGADTDAAFDPVEFLDRSLKRIDTKDKPGAVVLIARGTK